MFRGRGRRSKQRSGLSWRRSSELSKYAFQTFTFSGHVCLVSTKKNLHSWPPPPELLADIEILWKFFSIFTSICFFKKSLKLMIWKKKKKTLVLQEKFLGKFQYFMKILRQMLQNIFAYSYCFRRFLEFFFFKKKNL